MYVADEAMFKQRHYLFILWNNMDSEFILISILAMSLSLTLGTPAVDMFE